MTVPVQFELSNGIFCSLKLFLLKMTGHILPWFIETIIKTTSNGNLRYDPQPDLEKELGQAVLFASGLNETAAELDRRRAWVQRHIEDMKSKLAKADKTRF